MIRFLLKGLFSDKGRSRLPIVVVAIGVMLTVLMHAYVNGIMGDTIEMNARFSTGHLKVITKAYFEDIDQRPNDLAMLKVDEMLQILNNEFPNVDWTPRIQFGGLIDAPDEKGETRTQGPAFGMGIDFFSSSSNEVERLNLSESIVQGRMPESPNEVLLSDEFAKKLKVKPGNKVTLIGSTMNGSMAMYNFIVAGTIRFGSPFLDRGTILVDIHDVRLALDMEDAASEIVGFFENGYYNQESAAIISSKFSLLYDDDEDEFSPIMVPLRDQENMAMFVDLSSSMVMIVTLVFILAMSLVLWNAGLLGGLRRYGEIGVRLAIGERKSHVYFSMIIESLMIGFMGAVFGTIFGLFFAWLIQKYGIDISSMMQGTSVMMPSKIRAHITPVDFYLGFFPGVISTVIGTALSGIGIYKRKTAQLFKELEV